MVPCEKCGSKLFLDDECCWKRDNFCDREDCEGYLICTNDDCHEFFFPENCPGEKEYRLENEME